MTQSQPIIAIYHLLGIYRKSTYKLVRWTPKSCLNQNPNFQHLLNGLLQWMAKLRNVSGSWNSSWAGVLLHFRAACCTKPYKSGPNPEREFKMILQVMKLWWSTPTSERTISFLFFFPWEGPKNGVSWESYAQLYTSLLINQLFRWWERMTKAAIFCCETCVTRIGKKRVAPSLGRKKKRRKSLQTSRSLVYQMTSSSLARNWMLVGKALFSGVKLRFLRFIKNTIHQ